MPSRARLKVGRAVSDAPPKSMSPSSLRSCPHTQLNSVVLPAPLGPTRPTLSPAPTSKEMSWTAWIPPKDLDTLRSESSGTSAMSLWHHFGRCPVGGRHAR